MIRNNQRIVHTTWTVRINGNVIDLSNEDYFSYLKDQACEGFDNDNLDLLRTTLRGIDMIGNQLSAYYLENSLEIDELRTRIVRFLGQGSNDPLSSSNSLREDTLEPEYPRYLGNNRWKVGPSMLDECD